MDKYKVNVECQNCKYTGEIQIIKGKKVIQELCPNCECKAVLMIAEMHVVNKSNFKGFSPQCSEIKLGNAYLHSYTSNEHRNVYQNSRPSEEYYHSEAWRKNYLDHILYNNEANNLL